MTHRNNWDLSLSFSAISCTEENLRQFHAAGIRYMELTSAGKLNIIRDEVGYTRNGTAVALYNLAKSFDVTISSFHLPFEPFNILDPASLDSQVRKNVITEQSELIRAAADSGIGIAVIHPSAEPYTEEERTCRLDLAVEVMGQLTSAAKASGMVLALENLPRSCLCRSHDEMLYFLNAIPDLRVCYDTNHSFLESNEEYIRAVGSKIVSLHVSDYDFIDEQHALPGKGKNDWNSLMTALEEENYNGKFNYEVKLTDCSISDVAENFRTLI